ncbi:MAG: zinc ribbon domain-containing protein [Candidatus Bathyarchaeia archaeon]
MLLSLNLKGLIYKLAVAALLSVLLLDISGVVHGDQVDCSKLAFNPTDMPDELQGYAKNPISGLNFFQIGRNPEDFPGKSSTFFRMIAASWKTKPQCDYYSGYDRSFRLRRIFSDGSSRIELAKPHEVMVAALFIFPNEAVASSEYAQNSPNLKGLKEQAITGEQASGLTFTDDKTEKYGDESSTWIVTGSYPGENLKTRILCSMFRIKSAVAFFSSTWYEGNYPTSFIDSTGARIEFLDPVTPCRDAGLTAIRNWSSRLSRELQESQPTPTLEVQPPMRISLTCDKEDKRYESGERVLLTVRIESLVKGTYNYDEKTNTYTGGKYEVVKEISFLSTFTFPNGLSRSVGFGGEVKRQIRTDSNGLYSFKPFAPYLPGTYTVKVGVNPVYYGFPQYPGIADTVTLTVYESPVEPTQKQFDSIIELFKRGDSVPSNRKAVEEEYYKHWPNSKPPADMEYGALNNILFCKNVRIGDEVFTVSNGYNCPGYTSKTLRFLTKLRFGIGYSDVERSLLRGIDYGPIVRCAGPITSLFGNEHHAVVLYNYRQKGNWASNSKNIVLDPWPKQKPESFTLKDFCYFYANLAPPYEGVYMNAYGDPEWKLGDPFWYAFPTVGGAVYWNLEMKELGVKYVVPPETGTSSGNPFYPPLKPESKTDKTDTAPLPASIKTRTGQTIFECPVFIDVYNDKGKHVGLLGGRIVSDIEGAQLYINQRSRSDFFWYLTLPEGKYYVRIKGIMEGGFHILTTKTGSIQYYNASIRKDEVASLELDSERYGELLTMPNGEKIAPKTIIVETLEEDGREGDGRNGSGSGGILLIGSGVLVTILVAILLFTRRRKGMLYMPVFSGREEAEPRILKADRGLEAQSVCPSCGVLNAKSNRYCVSCGKILPSHHYCEECGREIPEGAVYCQSCGDKQGVA